MIEKTKTITITLNQSVFDGIIKFAVEEKRSKSNAINYALSEFLERLSKNALEGGIVHDDI